MLAFLVSAVFGALLGCINGLLVSALHIQPLVVTLGTYSIINGFMIYFTNGSWITGLPENLIEFGGCAHLGYRYRHSFLLELLCSHGFY